MKGFWRIVILTYPRVFGFINRVSKARLLYFLSLDIHMKAAIKNFFNTKPPAFVKGIAYVTIAGSLSIFPFFKGNLTDYEYVDEAENAATAIKSAASPIKGFIEDVERVVPLKRFANGAQEALDIPYCLVIVPKKGCEETVEEWFLKSRREINAKLAEKGIRIHLSPQIKLPYNLKFTKRDSIFLPLKGGALVNFWEMLKEKEKTKNLGKWFKTDKRLPLAPIEEPSAPAPKKIDSNYTLNVRRRNQNRFNPRALRQMRRGRR